MKKSRVIFAQNTLSHKKLIHAALLLPAIILTIFTTSAQATYQYTYTGNIFTTSSTTPNWPGEGACNPDPTAPCITTREEYVSVKFTSPSLLTSGASLSDIPAFTLTASDRILPYPYPYPSQDPVGGPGDPAHPNYGGVFDIFAVDANGLPTDWNISIDYNYRAPTARLWQSFIKTSTTQDITYGGYEGFLDYLGQLDNNPGTWSVTTAVPEPETYAMLLAGLGLIGFTARKRNS